MGSAAVAAATGIFYAVKIIDKARCGSGLSEVFSEVEIVSLLSHRYIIALKEVFDTKEALYLVPGGRPPKKLCLVEMVSIPSWGQ